MGHQGMKASLVSREIIADSIELMMIAHQYDGIVGIAGCDKSLPGTLMAMARLNLPAVFVYGGTILPGNWNGKQVTVQDVFEAVGTYEKGEWVCGECQIEEFNKRKMRVLGPDHEGVKQFIQKEDADCRKWNNYAKGVYENMGAGLICRLLRMMISKLHTFSIHIFKQTI